MTEPNSTPAVPEQLDCDVAQVTAWHHPGGRMTYDVAGYQTRTQDGAAVDGPLDHLQSIALLLQGAQALLAQLLVSMATNAKGGPPLE